MTQPINITAGRGFRVNNPPSASCPAGLVGESYSATSPEHVTAHGRENDRRPITSKTRNYTKTKWTIGEKIIILECFAYSRHECWGRQKDIVFESQIKASSLPKEKVEETTVKKLSSIVSQIRIYLTPDEVKETEDRGRNRAESEFSNLEDEEKQQFDKGVWTRSEKWTLVWTTHYAKTKFSKPKDSSKEWFRLFQHHCPVKKGVPRGKLTTQKGNILCAKVFSKDQLDSMETRVLDMLENEICPIQNPISVPPEEHCDNEDEPDIEQVLETNRPDIDEEASEGNMNEETTEHNEATESETINNSPSIPATSVEEETLDERKIQVEEELLNVIEEVKRMTFEKRPTLIRLKENKSFKDLSAEVQEVVRSMNIDDLGIDEVNTYHYSCALYIQRKLVPWLDENKNNRKRAKPKTPPWKQKINKRINQLRAEISQMSTNEPLTKNLINRLRRLKRKYGISEDNFKAKIAEHHAQLKALTAEIRNKTRKSEKKRINKEFKENPRKVYRDLMEENIEVEKPPEKEKLEEFWRPLFETPKEHTEHRWVNEIIHQNKDKPEMLIYDITPEQIRDKLKQFSNFKRPGVDKIPNFWLKELKCFHPHYAQNFNKIINESIETPSWLTTGTTSLIPKSTETTLPNKYRPICCLPTTYKLLTAIIADAMYEHLEKWQYLEEEQKGCRRQRQGTKHQLLINNSILEDCKRRARNLSMAWVDYKKAYDSVPHSWIIRCLDMYKINPAIKEFLKSQMQKWTMNIKLKHTEGEIHLPDVKVKRGIFQGDSLSPLLFCIAIDPLSKLIKKESIGYSLGKSRKKSDKMKDLISHLLFMDDLKLFAEDEKGIERLIEVVHTFSRDIGMEFGLDKCAKCTIKKGVKTKGDRIEIEEGKFVEDLEKDADYKYLGIEENATLEHRKLREKARKEYIRRLKKICRSELSPKNKIVAINQKAIPVLSYGFGIIDWPQKEIDSLDIKTRKILTIHKLIYRNQCIDRIYLPRRDGGMGLTEINDVYRKTIINLDHYLQKTKDEHLLKVRKQHQEDLPENKSITKLADICKSHHRQQDKEQPSEEESNPQVQEEEEQKSKYPYTRHEQAVKRHRWKTNKRAGAFYEETQKSYIDRKGSFQWIQNGELQFDEERLLLAAQDQGLTTNGFLKMCGLRQDDKCRFCHTATESTSHLVSGCQTLLADGHYTRRHNKVCTYLHWVICQDKNIPTQEVWLHTPQPVTATEDITIFYDKEIPAGRFIENGAIKPDIVVWDHKARTALIIDVSVPNDFGINRAEREKVTKYQDLKNALKEEWELNEILVVPVIVGATGIMKDNLQRYLDNIPGKPNKYQVQVSAIRGTVTLLKRALGTNFK